MNPHTDKIPEHNARVIADAHSNGREIPVGAEVVAHNGAVRGMVIGNEWNDVYKTRVVVVQFAPDCVKRFVPSKLAVVRGPVEVGA